MADVTRIYFFITIIIALIGWTTLARVVRGRFLALRSEDFVTAAELAGAGQLRIIFRHMVPSFLSHIIAATTLALPAMIIAETSLSFLGLGLRPRGQLGRAAATGVQHPGRRHHAVAALSRPFRSSSWYLAFNFLGDGLRDAADPYG
jgi:peptide/nickel transport system permease protein